VVQRREGAWEVRLDRIGQVRVPSTLKGVLQSRLDSLDTGERTVLQRASVVGRVFWDDAVAHLGRDREPDPDPVRGALERLRGRELVQQRAVSAFDSAQEFLFKHALLRDVAYEGMLRSHRRGYHALAAGWLTTVTEHHGRVDEYAALIAEHADRAGDPAAARWYLRAGAGAARVYASEEALRLLGRGLEVVDDDAPLRFDLLCEREQVADRLGERDRQRADLELMSALLASVDPRRRLRHDLARARLAFDTSDYDDAVRWAREAADVAHEHGLDDEAAQGHLWAGKALTWASDGAGAGEELQAALAIAQRAGLRGTEAETWRYLSMLAGNEGDYASALDLGTRARAMFAEVGDAEGEGTALAGIATVHYQQGRYASARAALELARPVFQRSGHRYREAVVLGNLGTIAAGQGELAAALGWVEEAIGLTRRLGDVEALATNLAVRAEIEAVLGRTEDLRRDAGEALELARSVRQHGLASNALSMLALAQWLDGHPQEALRLVDESIEESRPAPSERETAFALVIRGIVLLALGRPDEALATWTEAEEAFTRLDVLGSVLEARAGRARALLAAGDRDGAHAVVDALLPHLEASEMEGAQADDVAAACWAVLAAVGDGRAPQVRAAAVRRLRRRAELVGDDVIAAEYLARPAAVELLG
jgi:tetratricopeptide (TPR) repeat protein